MKLLKKIWNRVFIDGLSGMALGLFATLIIGTIMEQIGSFVPGKAGLYITLFAAAAKYMTGAGIGVGVATKFKSAPLVTVSAVVTGMVGAGEVHIIRVLNARRNFMQILFGKAYDEP